MPYTVPSAALFCLALLCLLSGTAQTAKAHISNPLALAVSQEGNIAVIGELQVEIMRGEESAVELEVKNYRNKVKQVKWTAKRGLLVVTEGMAYLYDEENKQVGNFTVRKNSMLDIY